jgi:hypothetical protein
LRTIAIVLAMSVAVATGCAPRDGEVRLARVAGEKRNLEETLDRLEDRLLADQARVRYWREMRERHESVAAIACAVQDEHADAMAVHTLPAEVRSPLHRTKVATASSTVTKPAVRSGAVR